MIVLLDGGPMYFKDMKDYNNWRDSCCDSHVDKWKFRKSLIQKIPFWIRATACKRRQAKIGGDYW